MRRLPPVLSAALIVLAIQAAAAAGAGARGLSTIAPSLRSSAARTGLVVGFSIEKPAQVAKAAALGVNEDMIYGSRSRALNKALGKAGVGVDGRFSVELARWECHRTHTVAPPPPGRRPFCAIDTQPGLNSEGVLEAVEGFARADAADPLGHGYWILDDWPPWDGGTARALLQEIRAVTERVTPGYPAICGFAGHIEHLGEPEGFEPTDVENFSSAGCSMVALYNYAVWGPTPSNGDEVEWSMGVLLGEQTQSPREAGWSEAETPLIGIGQAFSGPFDPPDYEQGLSAAQMVEQAKGFCAAGASSIGWYAWVDGGYVHGTQTPNNSRAIRQGITRSLSACGL